jgi:hypothetical protein
MSDIIREVDEELRRERMFGIWRDYGAWIVMAAVALVLAVAAWRGYEWYQARESAKIGASFEEALRLMGDGKTREAEQAFAAIASEASRGYRALARFGQAAEAGRTDPKAGAAAFDTLADDRSLDQAMRDAARLRAAMLLVDVAPASEVAARLEPLMARDSTFRHSARELMALARFKAGELDAARKLVFEIMLDPETPPLARNRAQLLLALMGGGAPAASVPATQ